MYYDRGLKNYASASNRLLRDFLLNDANINVATLNQVYSIDFPDQETVNAIIDINFKKYYL